MKEGFALRDVRIWFQKISPAIYISHLDLNRSMLRAIIASKLDIWYTQGFNPHPFITFAMPLGLGISGLHESMDIRLMQEKNQQDIICGLNNFLPQSIRVTDVSEPIMKPKDISFAKFQVSFEKNVSDIFEKFLSQQHIIVQKKTKSYIKNIDIKSKILDYKISVENEKTNLLITLPAGSTENVNPMLLIKNFKEFMNTDIFFDVTKINLYDKNMDVWR